MLRLEYRIGVLLAANVTLLHCVQPEEQSPSVAKRSAGERMELKRRRVIGHVKLHIYNGSGGFRFCFRASCGGRGGAKFTNLGTGWNV